MDLTTTSTGALRSWLAAHEACVNAGVNVGELARRKAQAFRLELIKRGGLTGD